MCFFVHKFWQPTHTVYCIARNSGNQRDYVCACAVRFEREDGTAGVHRALEALLILEGVPLLLECSYFIYRQYIRVVINEPPTCRLARADDIHAVQ